MRLLSAGCALVLALVACAPPGLGVEELSDLPEEYGCGHGFYVGNAEQTVGLFLSSQTGFGDTVDVGSHVVPSEEWEAEVRVGSDLFANWCNDVVEPGAPEPVVDEVLTVSGELRIMSMPPAGDCGPAIARLIGAVATSDSGISIDVPDRDLHNPDWGCFAG